MQAAIDRRLSSSQELSSEHYNRGREFTKSQETLDDAKAKQLRRQGKGKCPNKAQPYSETDEEIFWGEGKLWNHNGLALTNVNFKNLSETMGFRGRQDHYDADVEDFRILGSLSKPRRRRRRERHQTKGLMRKTIAVYVRYKSLYIS